MPEIAAASFFRQIIKDSQSFETSKNCLGRVFARFSFLNQKQSHYTQGKGQYIQRSQSDYCCHPVKRPIEIPGSAPASINVGDIGEKRQEGYQRMWLHFQDEREDITLAKETDNSYQPDFGLVVNSHEDQLLLSPLISLS
jgi:hypothetical protein